MANPASSTPPLVWQPPAPADVDQYFNSDRSAVQGPLKRLRFRRMKPHLSGRAQKDKISLDDTSSAMLLKT